jgi:hypothetical protein
MVAVALGKAKSSTLQPQALAFLASDAMASWMNAALASR